MDEKYSESVDISGDMNVADTDITKDISVKIPENIPEYIPEDNKSDSGVSDLLTWQSVATAT